MRTAVLLSTLLAHGVHGKSRSGGVAASCHRSRQTSIAWTKFSASNVACSPRGGQHGYGIYDGKDDIYDTTRGKPSPYLPYDEDRYSDPSNPRRRASRDYYNDYYGRPGDDERYIDEDRGYYDDRGLPSGPDGPDDGVGGISSLNIPNIIKTGNRQIGMPLLGIGAVLTILGVSLFFNKALMRVGNLFFVAGVPMTIGPGRTAGYFFQPTKARATGCLALGILLVFVGWPVFGIVLEVFGLLNLFGNMFPFLMTMLKTMPGIGPMLRGQGGSAGVGRRRGRYHADYYDDEDEYYGSPYDREFDDRNYYDDDVDPDDNRRYY